MRKPIVIAVMTLLGSTAFAAGEVYRWKDSSGVWNYSDQPHPGAELIRRSSASSAASSSPAPAAAQVAPATVTSDPPLPVSKEVANQVRKESADAQAELCKKTTADYQKYVQAPLIYKTDAEGKRVYMNAAEMDAARLQARAAKDLACGT
jgi:hypothetical protein